jgi:hypothetical protein
MAITKSNKLELSLDHNKPNAKMDAHLLGLLHSLALQRCFSAEQMSKRPLKEVERMYLYTP